MINDKPINQNPDRYKVRKPQWVVSAGKGIKPLTFRFGEPLQDLKPVIEADGVIIDTGEFLLCSEGTIKIIEEMRNPHYDVTINGEIMVKAKGVKLGNTIPIIKINLAKLPTIGLDRELGNKKAGVSSVTYTYEGEQVMGVPKGIVDQLNYTLVEGINRPGDTYSYWNWIKDSDTKYSIKQLTIDNVQEDGKFDQKKLAAFLKGVGDRLTLLRADFKSIKRTFFYGEVPSASGIDLIPIKNAIAKPEDDFIVHQYVEKETTTIGVQQSATQTAASSSVAKVEETTKNLTQKIEGTTITLQEQLAQEQAKDTLQQQQIRQDLQSQITRNDAYYREKYGKPDTK
jgi:hypothetical protein